MTNREALAAMAAGAVVRAVDGPPICHHATDGFLYRVAGEWLPFGCRLAVGSYEVVLSVPPPILEVTR
jgi:hypothetical protein